MKNIIIITALMLLLSAVGFGQKKMTVAESLTKIEEDIVAGIVKGDTTVFIKYFSEKAALTDPSGTLMTRAETITMFNSGDLKFETLTVEDVKVQLYGTTAIVTYRSSEKGNYKGQAITGKSRWTDTFIKMAGKWMIVSSHGTPIVEMPK